ncbi:hypothetical protein GWK47_012564 [Chionoecetes opilio]|uniref:Uncharacterized protein n=1 Tax=Chionoecetes opilio TaxID=41210 RepID=A0A8J4XWS4_CHIOP|nr:hypothetical protein GWK47_012564 [Chionoecetes opilio]
MKPEDSAARVDGLATDLRLIPEFDGALHAVGEWLEKLELVCGCEGLMSTHRRTSSTHCRRILRLPAAQQRRQKNDFSKIKAALISPFPPRIICRLRAVCHSPASDGESFDVYLADLHRLAALFGGIPDNGLICVFCGWFPSSVSHILGAGSRLEDLDITQF